MGDLYLNHDARHWTLVDDLYWYSTPGSQPQKPPAHVKKFMSIRI